eukprot:Partr_v1_DN29021_c0_g1_i2_m58796 putative Heat shock protein
MKASIFVLPSVVLLATLVVASSSDAARGGEHVVVPDLDIDRLSAEKLGDKSEKFAFQAEVNRMMKLIIHSLYKTKEIFLRELISNASDAIDKIRFLSLTKPGLLDAAPDLNITVQADAAKKVLVITDTGIGMSKKDLVRNLGTIAKSGTSEFLANLESKGSDSNLIGQFGVGFYSAFLVADKVTVISKSNDDKQHIWESHAEGDFTVFEDPRGNTLGRGTQIILHIKGDAEEFLDEAALEEVIRKYSEFINFPIYLLSSKTESIEVPIEENAVKDAEEGDSPNDGVEQKEEGDVEVEDVPADGADAKPTTKTIERQYKEWELMNAYKPIWTRDPKNISEKEYVEFYKSFAKDDKSPLSHIHFKAEGDVEFRSILYIPEKAAPNALQSADAQLKAIKLFVKRVFITDELIDFIPKWLSFMKGLVDSDDLPLNVSRENLQQHRLLKLIQRKVIRKGIELIKNISEDEDKYKTFLKEFGTYLKLGVIEDAKNKKKLLKLLRFHSSNSDSMVGLEDYRERMKKGQQQVFFLTGSSLVEIKKSPFVEKITARGYEVLYLDEPIDEYLIQSVHDYERLPFQNVAKEGLKFGDESEESKELEEELNAKFKPLAEYLTGVLSKNVEKVVISSRLTTSPCAIVASQYGWSGNMERMMSSQALNSGEDPMRAFQSMQKKTLEINPKHPIIVKMLADVESDQVGANTDELAQVLYEVTAIRSGYQLKDTSEFANRIERVLRTSLGVDLDAEVDLDDIVEAPEKDDGDVEEGEAPIADEVEAGDADDDNIDHDEF